MAATIGRRLALAAIVLATGAACDRFAPSAGPVALRDAEQLASFLASPPAWQPADDDEPDHRWRFNADGTFRLWAQDPVSLATLHPGWIPPGADRVSGTWSASIGALALTRVRTAEARIEAPADLALNWVDGKFRIDIGGRRYRRVMDRAGTAP